MMYRYVEESQVTLYKGKVQVGWEGNSRV